MSLTGTARGLESPRAPGGSHGSHLRPACRYAARLDGPGFLAWLLGGGELTFDRWLDTRTAALPGSGDRTGDLVASLHVNGVGPYWALPVEFQTTPDPEMTGRGLEMLGRLWREQRPPGGPGDRYQLGLAVINLTGNGRTSVDMKACGRRLATRLRVIERNLAAEERGRRWPVFRLEP